MSVHIPCWVAGFFGVAVGFVGCFFSFPSFLFFVFLFYLEIRMV